MQLACAAGFLFWCHMHQVPYIWFPQEPIKTSGPQCISDNSQNQVGMVLCFLNFKTRRPQSFLTLYLNHVGFSQLCAMSGKQRINGKHPEGTWHIFKKMARKTKLKRKSHTSRSELTSEAETCLKFPCLNLYMSLPSPVEFERRVGVSFHRDKTKTQAEGGGVFTIKCNPAKFTAPCHCYKMKPQPYIGHHF